MGQLRRFLWQHLDQRRQRKFLLSRDSCASIQDESLDFTLTIVSDQPTNQVILEFR